MASRIRILPEELTNRIAAGEVVERPASVVKELLENSLDAGSTDIIVEIENGGKRLIRVTDNGSGMSREEALLCLERHATSKIQSDEDLFRLRTLGFRGEAVPSIASVSRFTLATRVKGSIEGTELYVEGGRVREVKSCGMAEGTVISVRSLFFNTPPRLRFLKSTETEAGHVADTVSRLALSRPEVSFTFIRDGRTIFRCQGGSEAERAASLLTLDRREFHAVDHAAGEVSLRGLLASPSVSRSSSSSLYTYVNGRFVRDRLFQHALLKGCRSFFEKGRYPVAVLFLELPPEEVDVNVHPTKHEVRFRRQGEIHDMIVQGVEELLRRTPWETPRPRLFAPPAAASHTEIADAAQASRAAEVREAIQTYITRVAAEPQQHAFPAPSRAALPLSPPAAEPAAPATARDLPASQQRMFGSLIPIGQFAGAYILCQEGDDLVLIDQHAAHERVAFEELRRELAAGGVESQGLLFPEALDLSHSEATVIDSRAADLARLGFDIEDFGGNTRLVKGVPRIIADRDYLRILRDMIEELSLLGRSRAFSDIVEEILMRIACHSVVRGTHQLSAAEITALLSRMEATDFSSACPHGRPVMRRIGRGEIERMFRRL